jgi:hypothetical protein
MECIGTQQIGTLTCRLQVKTRSRACIHMLSCVLQLWIQPLCRDGLRHCHASYGFGPRLPVETGSGAATCPTTPDLTNLSRRAPALPCAIWLWASPPCRGGLQRCHVFHGFEPRVPVGESSSVATRPAVSCGARGLEYKERFSWPSYAARLMCFQGCS